MAVCDLVEEHLMNLIVVGALGQIAGDGNFLSTVITEAKTGFGIVEFE